MNEYIKPFELFEVGGEWFAYHVKSRRHHRVDEEDLPVLRAAYNKSGFAADESSVTGHESSVTEHESSVTEHVSSVTEQESVLTDHAKKILSKYLLLADHPWNEAEENKRLLDLIAGSRKKNPFIVLEIFTAQECNMSCSYCYGSGGNYHEHGLMDFATAKQALDWFREGYTSTEKAQIVFFGGEPMMNFPLIKECVEYACRLFQKEGVSFGMATNMTLMTDEHLDYFAGVPDFKLLVSIDGPERVHNRQRPLRDGRNSYAVTAERIRAALSRGIFCTGRATVYADTDRRAVEQEMKNLGLTHWQLSVVSGCAADGVKRDDSTRVYQKWLREWPDLAVRLVAAIKDRDVGQVEQILMDADLKKVFMEGISGRSVPINIMGCPAGRGQYALSVSGDLYPCHRFVGMKEFSLGNPAQGRRLTGWPEFHEERLKLRTACRECFLRYSCGGACYYHCYVDGTKESIYETPEHYCDFVRMRSRLAVYIFHSLSNEDRKWLAQSLS